MAITAWFLCDSETFHIKKYVKLGWSVWTTCIIIVVVDKVLGTNILSNTSAVKEIITPFYEQYWFITTYIIFSLLEPFFRRLVMNMDKDDLKLLCVVIFICCPLYNFVFIASPGYHLLDFISIYVFVVYLKRFPVRNLVDNAGKVFIVLWMMLGFGLVLSTAMFNSRFTLALNNRLWNINPLIILMAISLLLFVNNTVKIGNSRFINNISKCTLGVYIIHENLIFRGNVVESSVLWNSIFKMDWYYLNSNWFPIYYFGTVLLVFFVCCILEYVRSYILDVVVFEKIKFLDKFFQKIDYKYVNYLNGDNLKLIK